MLDLRENYRLHPSFSGIHPWELKDHTDLEVFNSAYEFLRSGYSSNNLVSYESNLSQCFDSVSKIFTSLKAQTVDNSEFEFLSELELEVKRLLAEEIAFYTKKPSVFESFQMWFSFKSTNKSAFLKERFIFGKISSQVVDKINILGANFLTQFRTRVKEGKLTREDLSFGSCVEANKISKILDNEFEKLGINSLISAYSGRPMHVGGVGYELSVPQAEWWKSQISGIDVAPKTLYAHFDESICVPKAIVYLSDVTEVNGPTGCYPRAYEDLELNPLMEIIGRVIGNVGNKIHSPLHDKYKKTYHQSATSPLFRDHFMRLPEELRFNSHFGWDVMPGSHFEESLALREKRLVGPAGSFIAFDGSKLLHRGGLVQQGDRIALQVIFVGKLSFLSRVINKLKRIFGVST